MHIYQNDTESNYIFVSDILRLETIDKRRFFLKSSRRKTLNVFQRSGNIFKLWIFHNQAVSVKLWIFHNAVFPPLQRLLCRRVLPILFHCFTFCVSSLPGENNDTLPNS